MYQMPCLLDRCNSKSCSGLIGKAEIGKAEIDKALGPLCRSTPCWA